MIYLRFGDFCFFFGEGVFFGVFFYMFVSFCCCFVFLSRRLKMLILNLQTASPTFKNDGFTMEILTFLKNQSFVLENWFGCFLALFLADFGWSVSYWKTGLGAFWRFLVFLGWSWGYDWVSGALRSTKSGFEILFFFTPSLS